MFFEKNLEETLETIRAYGCDAVEIGTGGFTPKKHFYAGELIKDDSKCKQLAALVKKHGLFISALYCHANMLHPDPKFSTQRHKDFRDVVMLLERLELKELLHSLDVLDHQIRISIQTG